MAQREPGRRGCLGPVDNALCQKEKRIAKRKISALEYKKRVAEQDQKKR